MSHFTVTVCLPPDTVEKDIKAVLDALLARWDENREVERYRDYEDGGPESYWWVSSVRRGAQEHRENAAVEIRSGLTERDGKVWRNGHGYVTPKEYERLEREDRADDAIWAERLGENPTWEDVVRLYNEKWGHGTALATLGDDSDDSEKLFYDPETGRAYTWTTRNPEAMWDWWVIGGRWRGQLHALPGVDESVLYIAERHWGEEPAKDPIADRWAPNKGLRCDGGPKRFLDFDSVRNQAEAEANDLFDAWEKLSEGIPHGRPWSHFYGLFEVGEITIDQARADYHSQPIIRALRDSSDDRLKWMDNAVERFSVGREEYARLERLNAVPGYALITLDGEWLAPGRMGWFGVSSDSEGEREAFKVGANRYLDELPADAVIVQIDCHI